VIHFEARLKPLGWSSSVDLCAADPTKLIELIEDLVELEEAGAVVADAAADARDKSEFKKNGHARWI
jgi:hypothetical protein